MFLVSSIATAKPSNPAFLGIGLYDAGGIPGAGPCTVSSIEKGTGAEKAGLRIGDLLVGIDGTVIHNCDGLIGLIQAKESGDVIKLDYRRDNVVKTVQAELLSRDEVLRRRFVGQPIPSTSLTRFGDNTTTDLSSLGRKTTVVGWFNSTCVGCDGLVSRVARWSRKITKGSPLQALGVVVATTDGRKPVPDAELQTLSRGLDATLIVADDATYNDYAFKDRDRVHFMVIDCRGVVQYAAPVAPNEDDTDAVLDELYAAAEQAARRMK